MAQYFLEEMDKESLNLAWFSGINMEDWILNPRDAYAVVSQPSRFEHWPLQI
jgi:hypothetical protein